MTHIYNEVLRNERECGIFEFWLRRVYSSILYHKVYRKRHPEHPYYVPDAIRIISSLLKNKQAIVFEWGSGISTVWYAKQVKSLVAIEHSEEWYSRGINWLQEKNLTNVDLKYIPSINDSFQNYTQAILKYDNNFFDLVAVDGRNRVECIEQAANKVKVGGYLILDDSHRTRYKFAFDLLTNYEYQRYDFGLLQTTIFRRLK
jgi:predicted O-methyltransferase YrrM